MSDISNLRIDSHQHFWKYDPDKYSWITDEMSPIRRDFLPEDLEPVLRKNGFDGCIAVQADQSEEETVRLLEHANTHRFIKGVVGWVGLAAQNVEERLELYSRDQFFKGVRHTVWDEKGEFLLDSAFQKGVAALEKFDLTYDVLVFDYQLKGAVDFVAQFPNQPMVLDHMGKPKISEKPSLQWISKCKGLGRHEHVFCKISGLVTETENFLWKKDDFFPFLDTIVETFGVDRLMFGSDWPVCLSAASYHEVVGIVHSYFSNFSEEDKRKIFGQNAIRFYNL